MAYANRTTVAPSQTRAQIEKMLQGFDCSQIVTGYDVDRAMLGFVWGGRGVRLTLPMPKREDDIFVKTPSGRARGKQQAQEAFELEVRRRWRALHLVIKAKITAIQDRITTFEREFLPDLVMPNGQTLIEQGGGPLKKMLESTTISLLPG